MNMRFVEKLDNGDQVVTYFQVEEVDKKHYYVYDGVNHGPFVDHETAVEAAYEDLILQATVSG